MKHSFSKLRILFIIATLICSNLMFANAQTADTNISEEKKVEIFTFPDTFGSEGQVFYNDNNLVLTASNVIYDNDGMPVIEITAKNSNDYPIALSSLSECTVNDMWFRVDGFVYALANQTSKGTISLSSTCSLDYFQMYGIGKINKIGVSFSVYNPKTTDSYFITEYAYIYMGDLVVDEKDVVLVSQPKIYDYNTYKEVLLYFENNTDDFVMVNHDNLKINGISAGGFCSELVYPNSKTYLNIFLDNDNLLEADITSVDDIDISLNIYKLRTENCSRVIDSLIHKTDLIHINLK